MSANNWRHCPECIREQKAKRERAVARAQDRYGKVTATQYDAMIRKANAIPEQPPEETLREDYYIGVYDDGDFAVSYSCLCERCGFQFSHKHTEQAAKPKEPTDAH